MEERDRVDVLICGAGAAGLSLAVDLARHGVSLRLVDRLPGPFAGSRGKGLQPRTLEVFEDLGLVDRVAAAGGPYPPQRIHLADGGWRDEQAVGTAAPTAQEPYRAPLLVPQFRTEAALRERLAEFGHAPAYGCALRSFVQDEAGVVAMLAGPAGPEMVRCRYLVGADGGRSLVRHALGLGFPGRALDARAVAADLRLDGLSRDAWHRFHDGDMARQLSFCPLPHSDLFQLQAPMPLAGEADLSTSGLQRFVDARLPGRGLVVREVAWASAYGMSARLAERYRVGRVLLIGDAAHVHPPTGGQGLNTSVQDAYNLGWKLAAVLAGAADGLLDSYEAERRPIAAAMLGLSTDLLAKAKQGDMRRGRELHQLDLGYPGSPLARETPGRETGLRAGERVPDARLLGAAGQPRRLFDLLQGPHWTLLRRGDGGPGDPPARRGLQVVTIGEGGAFRDVDGSLDTVHGLAAGDLLLVRPDGYVGAVCAAPEAGWLAGYLARVLPGTTAS